jgi:hypothetical protein
MFITALLFGLVSSLHCIGMCGPIALMIPLDHQNPARKALQIMSYHLGRMTSYAALGLLFGSLGKGLYLAGIQQELSIVAGVAILILVVIPERILARYTFSQPLYRAVGAVKARLGLQLRKKGFGSIYFLGLFNGFLPCGLVYAALFGAITIQNPLGGALYMAIFGIGTTPLMSALVYAQNFFTAPIRNKVQKLIPWATAVIAVLFILRGLGLGIQYVSPSSINLFVQQQSNCH